MFPGVAIIQVGIVVTVRSQDTDPVPVSIISYLAGAKQGYIALLKKARRLVVNRVPTKLRSQILRRVV